MFPKLIKFVHKFDFKFFDFYVYDKRYLLTKFDQNWVYYSKAIDLIYAYI